MPAADPPNAAAGAAAGDDAPGAGRELVLPPVSDDNACLPLAVNAVASYWGFSLPLDEAASICSKYPGTPGSILIEGMELAERHGLAAAVLRTDLAGLRRLIDAGIPPIAIIPGMRDVVQHASVISGYDHRSERMLHYIPDQHDEAGFKVGMIPYGRFDSLWSEDGRLAIAVSPPGAVPEMEAAMSTAAARSNRLCFASERASLLGDPQGAVRMLSEAVALDDSNSAAHSLLGSALNAQGSDGCVASYERGIELNGRSFLSHRGLGNYYIKKGMHAEAERHYTAALEINPSRYAPLYKNRAIARSNLPGRAALARGDLKSYLRRMPDAADAASIRQAIKDLS